MDFGLDFSDDLFDTSEAQAIVAAKAVRIATARAAASTYSAKIENPLWFNDVSPEDKGRKAIRSPQIISVQYDYYSKDYRSAIDRGIALLHEVKEGNSDEIEIVDTVLRAALRVEGELVEEKVLNVAAKWERHARSSPGLAYSAARIFQKANQLPQAINALLSAIIVRGPLAQYSAFLITLFLESASPSHLLIASLLSDHAARKNAKLENVEAAVEELGLSEERREKLMKLLVAPEEEDEADVVTRDVRSL